MDYKKQCGDFPDSPGKTLFFHYRELGFDPWSGNWDPTGPGEQSVGKKKKGTVGAVEQLSRCITTTEA